ncbi:MAG: DUF4412 domain-containing protein [Ignavibacteria bacterium]|nr:DUF4412 domain-containing protein [Ignavibacteria bacterium]
MKLFMKIFSFTIFFSFTCFAQFTADMVVTEGEVVRTNKFYSQNQFYRMDIEEQGQEGYVIVDHNEGVTKVVMPAEQMYMEMSSTGMQSMSNDVFQSIEKQKEQYETNLVGTETINGFECDKYEVLIDGSVVSIFWQSEDIEYPIKVVSGANSEMVMELKNIVAGDVDDSMFQIPDGYTKMDMPGMK